MDSQSERQAPRVVTLADVAKDMTPERIAAHEAAYRRGCHQSLAMAADIASGALTLGEARRMLRRAETLAFGFRFRRKNEGRLMLLDQIRREMYRKTGTAIK
jgi:hypothetical protein